MEISLALGGGGVRGVAHIGVLRALEAHGFQVKAIAGTSAGGLVGAVYAAGFNTEMIEAAVNKLDKHRSYERAPDDAPSLLGLSSVADILTDLLSNRTFDDLNIPFTAIAACLDTGEEVILRKGKVIDALMATIAVPGIFPSKIIAGRSLTDGGVVDPVPVRVARWMRPDLPVVAVMLHKLPEDFTLDQISLPIPIPGPTSLIERLTELRPVQAFKIFSRSVEISGRHLAELNMKLYTPEVIIAPRVGHIGLLQHIDAQALIEEGITATEISINRLKSEANYMRKIQRRVKHFVNPDPFPDYWHIIEE